VVALGAAGWLAGCTTTQQEAARLQLNAARIRASQAAVRVTRQDRVVGIGPVALVRGGGAEAIVVVISNRSPKAVSDLPISVGVRRAAGTRLYLNDVAGLPYFAAHIPAIAAGGSLTWIFTTRRQLPDGARPFAVVGVPSQPLLAKAAALPAVTAGPVGTVGVDGFGAGLTVAVRNDSGIPQYQLPVYAFVRSARGFLAAGSATVAQLASNSSTRVLVRLLGSPTRGAVQLEVRPTVFN
jgi:hypothetical protein